MRHKKNKSIKFAGVESVEIYKRRDNSTPNGYNEEHFVYDLEVEDNHNYNAEGILVHNCGAFPKPTKRVKDLLPFTKNKPIILMSGTPSPESFSQLYHQFYISDYSPFKDYKSFYRWAKKYVDVKKKYVYNREINDYSKAKKELIFDEIEHLFIKITQKDAGFDISIQEKVLFVEMNEIQRKAIDILKRDLVLPTKSGEVILADTAVKLQNKIHQICSGTVLSEDGVPFVLSRNKALFIKKHFKGQKIAIFYKYKQEFEVLKGIFPNYTTTPEHFQDKKDKVFLAQYLSGREGIRLDTADAIIFYNIDFSYLSYAQAKDRIISKERTKQAVLYYIFTKDCIEPKILKAVRGKKDYTLQYFKKDFGISAKKFGRSKK